MATKKTYNSGDLFHSPAQWDAACLPIYNAYPRKIGGRKAAFASIKKAILDVGTRKDVLDPVAWLEQRTKLYAAAMAGYDKKYIPYATTWFNQGRYDDDETEWSAWREASGGPAPEAPPATDFFNTRDRIRQEIQETF